MRRDKEASEQLQRGSTGHETEIWCSRLSVVIDEGRNEGKDEGHLEKRFSFIVKIRFRASAERASFLSTTSKYPLTIMAGVTECATTLPRKQILSIACPAYSYALAS